MVGVGRVHRLRYERNGTTLDPTDLPVEDASYALATDFSGGAALTAALGTPVGTVATGQSLQWRANGHLLCLMAFTPVPREHTLGRFRANGPEGQQYESKGPDPLLVVAEPTEGNWGLAIDAGVAPLTEGAVLWAITLPSS